MSEPILRIEGLRVTTTGGEIEKCLVDDVSLSLAKGEVLGLMGESGAGKTTVGLTVLGYTRPGCTISGGKIFFGDTDIVSLPMSRLRQLRGQHISYIAQSAAASFNPSIKIMDQVCEGPVKHGILSRKEAELRAVKLFAELLLPSSETFGDRYPHQVSGGQLQRAMVAMAMICQPQLLVLDEPTTALDVTTQIEVLAAIRRTIRNHGTAALYISHDLAVVAQMSDRIMIMRHGRMVEVGATRDIIERPQQEYTRQLVNERVFDHATQEADAESEIVLELAGVNASYGSVNVVQDVNLQVRRGETFAVVGESGSGKSTLARIICGVKAPTAGEVRFNGRVLPATLQKRTKNDLIRIQLIYQMPDVALNSKQTIETIIGRPVYLFSGATGKRRRARVAELLRMMELPVDIIDRKPPSLSGGQKQRVCIARALAAEPDLIICDEVTSALDPLVAHGILELLKDIQARTNVSYLFITHDLAVVRRVSDRVAVMQKGRIVEADTVDGMFQPPHHPYTARLLASMPEMRINWLDDAIVASERAAEAAKAGVQVQ